ncbi:MAG: GntR family transcriptional regulator [Bacteroidota bacterium]
MKLFNEDLGNQAYKVLREIILSGQLTPGEKIVQDKLAKELGISRTPLRTALNRLESESLIESIPRRGVVVKKFSPEEIIHIYDCRIAIEVMAIELFTRKASGEKLRKLDQFFLSFTPGEISHEKYREVDQDFHSYILANCGNNYLQKMFYQSSMMGSIQMIGLVRPPDETLGEHYALIEAVKNRDIYLSRSLMHSHLALSKDLVQSKLNE